MGSFQSYEVETDLAQVPPRSSVPQVFPLWNGQGQSLYSAKLFEDGRKKCTERTFSSKSRMPTWREHHFWVCVCVWKAGEAAMEVACLG